MNAAEHAAALGPFFAFAVHDEDAAPRGAWRPMDELARDPAVLEDRVAAVRARLGPGGGRPVPLRVAASVTHLGLTARLVSPLLALTALHGAPPALDLPVLRWQPEPGGLFPLSLPRGVLAPPDDPAGPGAFLEGPLHVLTAHTARFSVARRILWGNTASAVNGAATAAARSGSPLAPAVRRAAAALLGHPLLHAAHTPAAPGRPFRRTNCCLIYRAFSRTAAPGALCGDCVLAAPRP